MTLLLNEIHLLSGLSETMMVAAADRLLSKPDGSFDSVRRKLFPIPQFNGAISYFGLGYVYPNGKPQYVSTWLTNFINSQPFTIDIESFANKLKASLDTIIPPLILNKYPSGFHICGYNSIGLPDFWFLSNIGGMEGFQYTNLKAQYDPLTSNFLGRDAKNNFEWDEGTVSAKNGVQTYRNGDIRAHALTWEAIDHVVSNLAGFPDFNTPSNPKEYGEYIKFKFEFIAYLYKNWARKQIIGRPVDVLVLIPKNESKK